MNIELTEEEYALLQSIRENKEIVTQREQNIIRGKRFKKILEERIKEYNIDVLDRKFKYVYNYVRVTILIRAGLFQKVNGNRGISEEEFNMVLESMDLVLPSIDRYDKE